jgi:hypothetical protein
VHRWFLPIDAQEILKIRRSTRNGERTQRKRASSLYVTTSSLGDNSDWKCIWQCPVPPKVGVFAWKLARNALATQENMVCRGMDTPATCIICGSENKTSYHAMLKCPHTRGSWDAMKAVWDLPWDELLFEHIRTGSCLRSSKLVLISG